MTLELHPLCTLFPRLAGAEFEALKADIATHGLRQPIITHDGLILDGGNRYRACVEAGVEPTLEEFAGENLVSFVLSANLHRRHLSAGQQAAIVASAQDWAGAQPVGRPGKSGNVAGLNSVADRAGQSGASERTQRMADTVAKKSPELARQVAHGEISLPKALEQVAPRAPAPQSAPAVSAPAANADDHDEPDLLAELESAQKEIDRLGQVLEQITSVNDQAKQVAEWSQKFDQLAGRNAQLIRTCNEAQGQARYSSDLLAKIRKVLGVESNAEILAAITARRAA